MIHLPSTVANPASATGPCPGCGHITRYEPCHLLPRVVPLCDACETARDLSRRESSARDRWPHALQAMLPPGYRPSRDDLVPAFYQDVLAWTPGGGFPGGLGLVGPCGTGKSSAIACRLRSLRRPFRWWSGTAARDAANAAVSLAGSRGDPDAARHWATAATVPILVLDDISQGRMTEAWSSRLFGLLEARLSNNLPVLWTSQLPLETLRGKIQLQNGGDATQAQAIIRRLAQHSRVISAC